MITSSSSAVSKWVANNLHSTTVARGKIQGYYDKAKKESNPKKAEKYYCAAIKLSKEIHPENSHRLELNLLLANLCYDYAAFLEKQNLFNDADKNYQDAESYLSLAKGTAPSNNAEVCALDEKITNRNTAPSPNSPSPSQMAFDTHLASLANSTTFFSRSSAHIASSTATISSQDVESTIDAFKEQPSKRLIHIQELVSLAPTCSLENYREITRALLEALNLEKNHLINLCLLRGLSAVLLHRTRFKEDSHYSGDAFVLIKALFERLSKTHIDQNEQQIQVLLHTLSLLLDQMVYYGVQELDFKVCGEFRSALNRIDTKRYAVLGWHAQYVRQALDRIPYHHRWLQEIKHRLPPVVGGATYLVAFGLKLASGLSSGGVLGGLEPDKLWEAYKCYTEAFSGIHLINCHAWYEGLRFVDELIERGRLDALENFLTPKSPLYGKKILKEEPFLLGLSDRLERLAYGQHEENRNRALRLLNNFKTGTTPWSKHEFLQSYADAVLKRIRQAWPTFERTVDIEAWKKLSDAPVTWHTSWQTRDSTSLLNSVQDKAERQAHIALLPAIRTDIAEASLTIAQSIETGVKRLELEDRANHTTTVQTIEAGFAQNSIENAHHKSQLETIGIKISDIQQRLSPPTPTDSLLTAKEALNEYYEPALKIQRISGEELDLKHCYINLAIVKSQAQQEADKAKLEKQSTFYRPSSYEEIKQASLQDPIPLEELFNQRKLRDGQDGIPKRILIQGRAGIGKTTLCKKLVHLYQTNLWQDRFDAVIWVPLRQLKGAHKAYNLEKLLKHQHFSQHPDVERLAKQMSRRTNKTLFILDGWDEIAADLNEGTQLKTNENTQLKTFLEHLLKQPHVIVTSRPTGVGPTKLGKFDLELETIGFSSEDVSTYLGKVEPESATKIQALINNTPVMRELANIPVQLDALCFSWKEIKAKLDKAKAKVLQSEEASVTVTTLYQTMVDKLLRKDAERLAKKSDEKLLTAGDLEMMSEAEVFRLMANEVEYLLYLSFKGLQDNLIEFDLDYINKAKDDLNKIRQQNLSYSLQNDLKQTSFLHTSDAASVAEKQRSYHFLHLTFQEFFAAKFLAKHLQAYLTAEGEYKTPTEITNKGLVLEQEELRRFVNENKYNPRYQIVWWMAAGLLEGDALEGFFNLLEKEPRDLIGNAHAYLIMHCLHDTRARLKEGTIERLEEALMKRVHLEIDSQDGSYGYRHSLSGSQSIFPEHLLFTALTSKGFEHKKLHIMNTIRWARHRTFSPQGISALIKALKDSDGSVRYSASEALSHQETLPDEAVLALIVYLSRPSDLDEIFPESGGQKALSAEVVSALKKALENQKEQANAGVVGALSNQETLPVEGIMALIKALESENKQLRTEAARLLGNQKTLPAKAVQALAEALGGLHGKARIEAAKLLGNQKTLPAEGLLALIKVLDDSSEQATVEAAKLLGKQKALPTEGLLALIKTLESGSNRARAAAAKLLGNQKTLSAEGLLALIKTLESWSSEAKIEAAKLLGNQKTLPAEGLLALIEALGDSSERVRVEAARVLNKQEMPSLEKIIKASEDPKKEIGVEAAMALGSQETLLSEGDLITALGSSNEKDIVEAVIAQKRLSSERVLTLISILKDEKKKTLSTAIEVASRDKTPGFDLLSKLLDKDFNSRHQAANKLRAFENLPSLTILGLIAIFLQEENKFVRFAIARALTKQKILFEIITQIFLAALESIKFDTGKVLDVQKTLSNEEGLALIPALKHQHWFTKVVAIRALGTKEALSSEELSNLITVLKDSDAQVRTEAFRALVTKEALSSEELSNLFAVLKDSDVQVRTEAVRALGTKEALSSEELSNLIAVLKDSDAQVRTEAVRALGRQKTLLPEEVLIKALEDSNEQVRVEAAKALGRQKTSLREEEALLKALEDSNEQVRTEAFRALGRQKTLLPKEEALLKALEDFNEQVRVEAAKALGRQKTLLPEEVLIKALKNSNKQAKAETARDLGKQTLLLKVVLNKVLEDSNEQVKAETARDSGRQKTPLPEEILEDSNEQVRAEATRALDRQGEFLSEYSLIENLINSGNEFRYRTTRRLIQQETLSAEDVLALIKSLESLNEYFRTKVLIVLSKQEILPAEGVSALINAFLDPLRSRIPHALKGLYGLKIPDDLKHLYQIKPGADKVLNNQKTLPVEGAAALIEACRDKDESISSRAYRLLKFNIDLIYPLLPNLKSDQIRTLYSVFLNGQTTPVPLYIQDDRLWFYTTSEPRSIPLGTGQIDKLNQAFIEAQKKIQALGVVQKKMKLRGGFWEERRLLD